MPLAPFKCTTFALLAIKIIASNKIGTTTSNIGNNSLAVTKQ